MLDSIFSILWVGLRPSLGPVLHTLSSTPGHVMLAKLKTFSLVGVEAVPVEVDVSPAGLGSRSEGLQVMAALLR